MLRKGVLFAGLLLLTLGVMTSYAGGRKRLRYPVKVQVEVSSFTAIRADIPVEIIVNKADACSALIETRYENLEKELTVQSVGDTLVVSASNVLRDELLGMRRRPVVTVRVSMAKLSSVKLQSEAELEFKDVMEADTLKIGVYGKAQLEGKGLLASGPLTLEHSSENSLKLKDIKASAMDLVVAGSGKVSLGELVASTSLKISYKGVGSCSTGGIDTDELTIDHTGTSTLSTGDLQAKRSMRLGVINEGKLSARALVGSKILLELAGNGDMSFKSLKADKVEAKSNGKGDVDISGSGECADFTLSSTFDGDFNAIGLECKNVQLQLGNSCEVRIGAKENLNIQASSYKVTVRYRGLPRITIAPGSNVDLRTDQ
jgi:hypothetical protein